MVFRRLKKEHPGKCSYKYYITNKKRKVAFMEEQQRNFKGIWIPKEIRKTK